MSLFALPLLAAGLAAGCTGSAPCQSGADAATTPPASAWDINVGPGVALIPRYPGSRVERALPLPLAKVTYGRFFVAADKGLGVYLLSIDGLQIGSSVGVRVGRHHDDGPKVSRLDEIGTTANVRAFVDYRLGPFALSTMLSKDVRGSKGATLDTGATWRLQPSPRLAISVGAAATFGNRRYLESWFGITPAESVASGLPSYSIGKAGLQSAGPTASVEYSLGGKWTLLMYASDQILVRRAAASPVVERRSLPTVALGAVYHFGR